MVSLVVIFCDNNCRDNQIRLIQTLDHLTDLSYVVVDFLKAYKIYKNLSYTEEDLPDSIQDPTGVLVNFR